MQRNAACLLARASGIGGTGRAARSSVGVSI